MEIKNFSAYLDGGTFVIITTDGIYYIDRRIKTKTKNRIFTTYPNNNNFGLIENQDEIKNKLIKAIDIYNPIDDTFSWKEHALELLNNK